MEISHNPSGWKRNEKTKFNIKATKTCMCEEGKMVDIESEQ